MYDTETIIATKCGQLTNIVIDKFNNNFKELSPAGKVNATILGYAITLSIIKELSKPSFNLQIAPINYDFVIELLINSVALSISQQNKEYKSYDKVNKKYNVQFFDRPNEIGNNMLSTSLEDPFIDDVTIYGIKTFMREFKEFNDDFNRRTTDKHKAAFPYIIFISLYFYPFFYVLCPSDKKENYIDDFYSTFLFNPVLNKREFMRLLLEVKNDIIKQISNDMELTESLFKKEVVRKPTQQPIHNQSTQKNCYIATMAYGDIEHPNVRFLREFRDDYLVNYKLGKLFIRIYYKHSPTLAQKLKPYKTTNFIIKKSLDLLIKTIKLTNK